MAFSFRGTRWNSNDWATRWSKSFRHNTSVWRTDRWTDSARRHRLRYAERRAGKNHYGFYSSKRRQRGWHSSINHRGDGRQVLSNIVQVKVKLTMLHKRAYAGVHPPLPGLEPVGGEPLMPVMRGQCDARPTVTFPAARHHRPLAGTKLYCLVTEAQRQRLC